MEWIWQHLNWLHKETLLWLYCSLLPSIVQRLELIEQLLLKHNTDGIVWITYFASLSFLIVVHITWMHLLFEKKISLISKRKNSLITFDGVHSVDAFFEQTRGLTISNYHGFVQSQQATYHNNRSFCMSGSQLANLSWSLYTALTQFLQLFNVWELLRFNPEHELGRYRSHLQQSNEATVQIWNRLNDHKLLCFVSRFKC